MKWPFLNLTLPWAACVAAFGLAASPSCERRDSSAGTSTAKGESVPSEPVPAVVEPPPPPPEPDAPEEAVDTTSKVAILGYHGFTDDPKRVGDMWIHIDKFRDQMQTLQDNKIPVIRMGDLLAWRRGEKYIPPFSVVITVDDGWKSTHTLALPVFKQFGYPFTVYLYTNFLGGSGKTLSIDQVKDLVDAGAEIGSHSISHQDLRRKGARSDESYQRYLQAETAGSREILQERLGLDPVTFAYPYGVYNEAIIQAAVGAGYEAMVTVNGRAIDWETDSKELHRYIVLGKNDTIFAAAIATRAPGGLASGDNLIKQTESEAGSGEEVPLVIVKPEDGELITDRQPRIEANLSRLEGVDPTSVDMQISGVGSVVPEFDETSGVVSYQVQQRLRQPEYWVQLLVKRAGKTKPDVMRWRFNIDSQANYLPPDWEPAGERDSNEADSTESNSGGPEANDEADSSPGAGSDGNQTYVNDR